MKRLHLTVSGRVQGVGFRYFTLDTARAYKLSGWVRNRYDGSVELEVQGEEAVLDRFCQIVREGPPLSHVAGVKVMDKEVLDNESEFQIRH